MPDPTQTMRAQQPAIFAMAALVEAHPQMPGAYMVLSQHEPEAVSALLPGLATVEVWREALCVAPEQVALSDLNGDPLVEFTALVAGVPVRMWAVGDPLAEPVVLCHAAELRAGHPHAAHEVDASDGAFAALAPGRPVQVSA
ncbi:hypothetical protein LHJ74_14420 [Streptomyces sp. N2-109]|uniref:SseB protein N-terminal domain-containing protein n=1 Tax=Streptomyces gossypii TaxID=2883101 RepID=A0ABT2JT61_9ACTN|nr:hypothetical protein [Streptomyces gossypii]MCT2591088.1 hypothetical protein [Streptomyces gossypii]